MFTYNKRLADISYAMAFFIVLSLISISSVSAQPESISSADGRYEARIVIKGPRDIHYKVVEIETNREVLTTFAKFSTPNDVKAGLFSPDLRKFAAAYHYGHEGPQTWIGVWNLETGRLERKEMMEGWVRDISSIFDN